jgi:AcrR family transcriptional regulator
VVVKGTGSGHRSRQAQATREQIARAARRLFAERGYAATSIAAIAAAADIPVQTVYSSLHTKAGILAEVLRLWILDSDVQRLHDEALAQPDPVRRLRLAAHWHRRQMELGYDVIAIYTEAARTDPAMAQEWQDIEARRERAVAKLIASLKTDLDSRLTPQAALDLYLVYTLAEVYRLLVIDRYWSLEVYERWLGDQLVTQLLRS